MEIPKVGAVTGKAARPTGFEFESEWGVLRPVGI